MMGMPVEGPAYIYGDNQSVLAKHYYPRLNFEEKESEYYLLLPFLSVRVWPGMNGICHM